MGPLLEPWAVLLITLLVFPLLAGSGAPVAASIGITSLLAFVLLGEDLSLVGSLVANSLGGDALIAVPLYILAGILLARSGVAQALLDFLLMLMGNVRGGMVPITGGASVVFGGMSGSGPADTAALSEIFVEPMHRRGYPRSFAASLCAAGGTLGLVIPPSTGYILYSLISERASIADLFIAGIVPGLVLAFFLVVSGLIAGRRFDKGSSAEPSVEGGRAFAGVVAKAIVGMGGPVIILGGIYSGTTTVTEAATVAVVYALFVGVVIFRELTLKSIIISLRDAGIASGVVLIIVAASSILSWVVSVTGWAREFSEALSKLAPTATLFVIVSALIFLVCGVILDGISMYFIMVPLMMPAVDSFGIDPIYFGVVVTMSIAIGLITPPMGLDLFAAASVTGVPFGQLARWSVVFVAGSMTALAFVIAFPMLSLALVE